MTYANVIATLALFLALGGGAYALSAVPDHNGVFHGCVSKTTGVLRVVKGAHSCHKPSGSGKHRNPGEFAIAWNQQGRPGANGVSGVNGANGVNGVNGMNGATNVVVRTQTVTANFAGRAVSCNSGERAVSGGASLSDGSSGGGDTVVSSFPFVTPGTPAPAGSTPTGWQTSYSVATSASMTFYAVCASP